MQKLIDEGILVEIDIEGKTDTKAGWSQILSGYYPEVTGVYSNRQYQPIPKPLRHNFYNRHAASVSNPALVHTCSAGYIEGIQRNSIWRLCHAHKILGYLSSTISN